MEIRIFDVTHGFCAYLIADNGNVMLFDCGHNEKTGFRPSTHLANNGCTAIEWLIIQNFDQDHVGDLLNILGRFPPTIFYRNRSISAEALTNLKLENGRLTDAMSSAIGLHRDYVHSVDNPPAFPDIEFETFSNPYPTFTDTNNLSLVSFIHYDNMGIIFPGDLEVTGWQALLSNPYFRSHLERVTIFIASHHGRVNGYCADVFKYCKPEIIIISDKEIVHDTQKQIYGNQQASGLTWNGGPEMRYVLTTRSDGMIKIEKTIGNAYQITAGGEQ